MKTRHFLSSLACLSILAAGALLTSCSTDSTEDGDITELEGIIDSAYSMTDKGGGSGTEGGSLSGNTQAGIVTAGEWNDLEHWAFWSGLMTAGDYTDKSNYWQCFTNHRVAVEVTNTAGNALAGIPVQLIRIANGKQTTLWEAVTDCHGHANCWLDIWQMSTTTEASNLRISIDRVLMDGQPVVCEWDSLGQPTINKYVYDVATTGLLVATQPQADIAFVVDATGSMADEINFLKSDLLDIIGKVTNLRPNIKIRTSALFYRDEGDDYLTRLSDFTDDANTTAAFVSKQDANGGGDYPEAVHTALNQMLKNLSWSPAATTRLAFLILDAPAHHQADVILSLQKSIQECARQGIRIIPVAASGVDKNTEFMLRFFAITTGGTYVFLTDDSGVGYSHLKASVGEYEIEPLNSLIIRLIASYTE